MLFITDKDEVCRYVARANAPFAYSVTTVTMQIPGVNIVLGVCHIDVFGDRIDHHAVWNTDFGIGAVLDEIVADHLMTVDIYYTIGYLIAHCHIAPLCADDIE